MEQTTITRNDLAISLLSGRGWRPVGTSSESANTSESSTLKLLCFQCEDGFVLDADASWRRDPEEMELVGRRFLNVPPDAALCPRCLHEVETAGAVRMYWSRAGV